ncbi:MAG: hypothetical protein V4547_17635 [Bacteroidota bacterium]
MKKRRKLVSMVDYILAIDWMGTAEFCKEYGIQEPYFTGEIESSAKQFLKVDCVKHRLFVQHAKFLNKPLNGAMLKGLEFHCIDMCGGHPQYESGKYQITNDEYGFYLQPYDSVDGARISKVMDLIGLEVYYHGE